MPQMKELQVKICTTIFHVATDIPLQKSTFMMIFLHIIFSSIFEIMQVLMKGILFMTKYSPQKG